jgi:hypothetical protein
VRIVASSSTLLGVQVVRPLVDTFLVGVFGHAPTLVRCLEVWFHQPPVHGGKRCTGSRHDRLECRRHR